MSNMNGYYGKVDVEPINTVTGSKIEGKLSDFKGNLRHLWQDSPSTGKSSPKKRKNYSKYINVKTLDDTRTYLTYGEAAQWLLENHGIEKGMGRIENWAIRGVLNKYIKNGNSNILLSLDELKDLKFDKNNYLLKHCTPRFNQSAISAAYKLNIEPSRVVQAVREGRITPRNFEGKLVYFNDDIRAIFPAEE